MRVFHLHVALTTLTTQTCRRETCFKFRTKTRNKFKWIARVLF